MATDGRTRRRAGEAQRAGDVVGALFGGATARRLSASQVAARAWFACNGDRERSHTTGVWLRKSGRAGIDPVMVVRLDSGLLAQDLGTNKDIYLARLSHADVRVSDIRFEVGGAKGAARARSAAAQAKKASPAPLRELTSGERRMVEESTAELPEGLRKSVARAMRATLARSRDQRGQ